MLFGINRLHFASLIHSNFDFGKKYMVSCDGAPVPGRPTIWIVVGQGPIVLAVGAGGVVWTILLSSVLSVLFLLLFGRRSDID